MKLFKKILIGALATTAIISLVACGKANNNKGDQNQGEGQKVVYEQTAVTASVSFSSSERHLNVGDTYLLAPKYEKISGYTMKYSSTAPAIVSVDENTGFVRALNEGTAVVKATYSNGRKSATAAMTITCDFGNYVPEIRLANIVEEEGVKLRVGSSFALASNVSYNGTLFDDGDFNYLVSDTSIAKISGGKITGLKAGETFLIIRGTWRGRDVTESVSVTVAEDVVFYNDGEVIQDFTVYSVGTAEDGATYTNTVPSRFTVNVGGVASTNVVRSSIGDGTILAAKGTYFEAKKYGETTVTLTTTVNGTEYSKSFNVTVLRPEVEVGGQIEMFATDYGAYLDKTSSTGARKTIVDYIGEQSLNQKGEALVDAYQNDKAITVDGDKVYGISSSNPGGRGTAQVVVGTDTYLYRVNLEVVAKYFTVASDLKELEIKGTSDLGGYYELLNNIVADDITLTHSGSGAFTGIFDGNGYIISDLTLAQDSSMFGDLETATIKNLALVDLNATRAYYFSRNGHESGLVLNNIYIKLSANTEHPKGITNYSGSQNTLKNVVIDYSGVNAEAALSAIQAEAACGVLFNGLSRGTNEDYTEVVAADNLWSDVYVISPYLLTYSLYNGFITNKDKPLNDPPKNPEEEKNDEDIEVSKPMYTYGLNEAKDKFGNDTNKTVWLKYVKADNDNKVYEDVTVSLTDLIADKKITLIKDKGVFKQVKDARYSVQYLNMKFHNVYHFNNLSELQTYVSSQKDANGDVIPADTYLASFSLDYWDISSGAPVWIVK